jgi:hypothetical protein
MNAKKAEDEPTIYSQKPKSDWLKIDSTGDDNYP